MKTTRKTILQTKGFMLLAMLLTSLSIFAQTSTKNDLTATIENEVDYTQVLHKTIKIKGIEIFYREAGRKDAPTILLLHGYPTSSHMFRNLIKDLADDYHLLAPDYPGFGRSEQPAME